MNELISFLPILENRKICKYCELKGNCNKYEEIETGRFGEYCRYKNSKIGSFDGYEWNNCGVCTNPKKINYKSLDKNCSGSVLIGKFFDGFYRVAIEYKYPNGGGGADPSEYSEDFENENNAIEWGMRQVEKVLKINHK